MTLKVELKPGERIMENGCGWGGIGGCCAYGCGVYGPGCAYGCRPYGFGCPYGLCGVDMTATILHGCELPQSDGPFSPC